MMVKRKISRFERELAELRDGAAQIRAGVPGVRAELELMRGVPGMETLIESAENALKFSEKYGDVHEFESWVRSREAASKAIERASLERRVMSRLTGLRTAAGLTAKGAKLRERIRCARAARERAKGGPK